MAAMGAAAQLAQDAEPERAGRLGAPDGAGLESRDRDLELRLRLLLASGGDERISPDPRSGRNRYGTTVQPAPEETWFSSSTATTISERGYCAALADLRALTDKDVRSSMHVQDWFGQIRAEITSLFGCKGTEAVLAGSGTDAELIVLAIAERLMARPITNIVVAPNETGSGVAKAAAGLNFLATSCLGGQVAVGERLAGWEEADIEVKCVDIRTPEGAPRDPHAVDMDVTRHAASALAHGRGVLLHVLDTSKTGLAGPSRRVAEQIAASAPDRVLVMVDACQLRSPPARLRADVGRGFMVLITGSKFGAGPPLSGALLLPGAIAARLGDVRLLPEGLADYSACQDWPERLQATFARNLTTSANLGAGLRWSAALAELRLLAKVEPTLLARFLGRFEREVRMRGAMTPRVASLEDGIYGIVPNPSIDPLLVRRVDGCCMSSAELAKVQGDLRRPMSATRIGGASARLRRIFHVGQPVQIGARAVLRVCVSAPQVNAVAARVAQGASFEDAFAPISADLQALFGKLGDMLSGECV
jgi:hypothetical protein